MDADILEHVLRPSAPRKASDLRSFLAQVQEVRTAFSRSVDRAIACGALADRVGFAFASGYQAALTALVPSLDPARIGSFCVTEPAGNHPRAIETRLEHEGGTAVLNGEKRWSTMAPIADVLVIVAKEGMDAEGRPRLKAVRVPVGTPGLEIREMPPTPFVPEVPHAELSLRDVRVPEDHVLPGDGFSDYSKAFRTVEDLHVNMAVLSYLTALAARKKFTEGLRERAVAWLLAGREIGSRNPLRAETHIALAGLLGQVALLVEELDREWEASDDAERALWQRDRGLVQVAGKAREQRRIRAWETLLSESSGRHR